MAEKQPAVGCARPTGGVLGSAPASADDTAKPIERHNERVTISVGRPAPDFVSPAYHQGRFTQVKLSDHIGKWIVLCFYPGDFTFV